MGQYFRLVDLDGGVALAIGLSKLGEGIWEISLHDLLLSDAKFWDLKPLDEFRHSCLPSRKLRSREEVGLRPRHGQKQSQLLKVLPYDVLRLIFESLGPPDPRDMSSAGVDVASLALTCQLLCEVGYPVLKRHQAAVQKTWSGHRLIIAGDYQDPDDLPPGLEVDPSWKLPETNIYTETESWPQGYADLRDTLDKYVAPTGNIFSRMEDAATTWAEVDATVRGPRYMWLWSMFAPSQSPPVLSDPVLRNLTAKEYVRGDTLRAAQRDPRNTYIEHLNVGDLAAFRIVWSSDPSVAMVADDSLVRGPWAGHRFDIVDMAEADFEGWTDVSDALIEEVAELYWQDKHY